VIGALRSGDRRAPAILARENPGRGVHFAAPEILCAGNLLWRAIRWVVHGETGPCALRLSRHRSLFSIRFDMDMSKYANDNPGVCTALYRHLQDWRRRFGLVASCYINIGCDQHKGEYTDWTVSGPIYTRFQSLGNEIGTHSYSHPFKTGELTDAELDFEFLESKRVIEQQLGVAVRGAAVPGGTEPARVSQKLNHRLDYLSGRYSGVDGSYPGAIGFPTPDYRLLYLCYHLYSDYTLVEWHKKDAAQAESQWIADYERLLRNADQPVVHVLWHDYGPTIGAHAGYRVPMYENLARCAHRQQAEFVTVRDLEQRIRSFMETGFSIVSRTDALLRLEVRGERLGQFAVRAPDGKVIRSVSDWYAYDDRNVFLPRLGGDFSIALGATQAPLTHVHSLPMRAELVSVAGDGVNLSFVISGAGSVVVQLADDADYDVAADSADEVVRSDCRMELRFARQGEHHARITRVGVSRSAGDSDTAPGGPRRNSAS
jgi:peptidoglycan/xylan/chitin deacetylase (PgdA/CDA1 family)